MSPHLARSLLSTLTDGRTAVSVMVELVALASSLGIL